MLLCSWGGYSGGQILHQRAPTTSAIRAELQRSTDTDPGAEQKTYDIGYFHIDICEALTAEGKAYLYEIISRLKSYLNDFMTADNYAKKLKTLKILTPMEKILHEYKNKPNLFHSNRHNYSIGLNI